eukprot:TRINITY_DN9419_c2_g2_i4.p1 TRINITY_DN9419_c2_g2~~TRINITY_DN9419_c2_g2_i4.p1  ORF type:complete len:335 (+),score=109.87 TRINITY_DN9419_c2_g2_i4:45-1007(+)
MAIPLKDIEAACERVKDVAHMTPVMTCKAIDDVAGREIFFKCEHLQKVGAFKIRGAVNAVTRLQAEGSLPAVVTHSSGNHAQALALAGKMRGVEAHIIMPKNAPKVKVDAVRDTYKANVYFSEPTQADREATANRVARETNGVMIHPYDHPYVQEGQGTAGYEFMKQVEGLDAVVLAIGGGGMFYGMASAIKGLSPTTKVYAAEPEKADDAYRGYTEGNRVVKHSPGQPATMADGLLTLLSPSTYQGLKALADGVITVSEQEISAALRIVMERMKQVIEPSAAVAVAAALSPKLPKEHKRVGVVLCGGNIDSRKSRPPPS